jgi:uncharacterized membrane-anchored protein YitT (DUF2179 family)
LAIRARQTKVMMVCCESQDVYNKLKHQNTHESIKEIKLKEGYVELNNSVLKNDSQMNGAAS